MRDYISLTAAVIVFVARSVLSCRQAHHYLLPATTVQISSSETHPMHGWRIVTLIMLAAIVRYLLA